MKYLGSHVLSFPNLFFGDKYSTAFRYKGGPALPRKMISVGDAKQLSVEVFPLCLNLHDTRDRSHKVIRLSKKV